MRDQSTIPASVIIPTHNRPHELADALESLRSQTFQEFETIVVNDGAQDVQDIVHDSGLPRIHHVRTPGNLGPSAARNLGLQQAQGMVIFYLDDDDVFYDNHIQTHMEQYRVDQNCSIVYTDAHRGRFVSSHNGHTYLQKKLIHSHNFDHDSLLVYNYIPMLCLSHLKTCLKKVPGFCEELTSLEDWDFFIHLAMHWKFTHIPTITGLYYERSKGESIQEQNRGRFMQNLTTVYTRSNDYLLQHEEMATHIFHSRKKHLAKMMLETGALLERKNDLDEAEKAYARAAQLSPTAHCYLSMARVQKAMGLISKALQSTHLAQACMDFEGKSP